MPEDQLSALVRTIDEWRAETTQRFDGIAYRLDGIDQRFDGIDQRFDGIDQRFDGIDQRLDEQARSIQAFSGHLTSRLINFEGLVDQKFSALEERLRAVEIGILNEIAMQSRRTTRVEERLNRVEGAA